MVHLTPTQRPQAQRVVRPATPASKLSPTQPLTPAKPAAEQPAEQKPGCFAEAFNRAFIAVMTKLFGRNA